MRVRVHSDGRESARLSDNNCTSMSISVESRSSADAQNIRELKDVLFGKESGTFDREVTATVVGRFHRNRLKRPPQSIQLVSVSAISVRRIDQNRDGTPDQTHGKS